MPTSSPVPNSVSVQAPAPMPAQTAFVLIHGGYHGAWTWERLTPLLAAPVLAVDLPGRGAHPLNLNDVTIEACAKSVVEDVEEAGLTRVLLVGHSLGGATLPAIGGKLGCRLAGLVFVASLVAPDGLSVLDAMPPGLQEQSRANLRRGQGAHTDLDLETHRRNLCNDMDEEQARYTLERLVPDSLRLFTDRVSWAGVPANTARTYIRLSRDQSLPPPMQDIMIGHLGPQARVMTLDTGHSPMISNPPLLAGALNSLLA